MRETIASATIPSICDHPAGELVDGSLPLGDNPSTGFLVLNLDSIAEGQFDQDASLETSVELECSQGGVAWPSHLLIFDDNFSLLLDLDVGTLWPAIWQGTLTRAVWNETPAITLTADAYLSFGGDEPGQNSYLSVVSARCGIVGDIDTGQPNQVNPITGAPCADEDRAPVSDTPVDGGIADCVA